MIQGEHYSQYLKTRFEERVASNPSYSLRAFARDLQVSPSKISEVLKRKQGLSKASALKISNRLGLSGRSQEYFCNLVLTSDARAKKVRSEARAIIQKMNIPNEMKELQEDAFRVISDWHHFSLLELVLTEGFQNDFKWIAKRLGIQPFVAEQAIVRLLRVGLLRKEGKNLVSTGIEPTTSSDIPSEPIRKFHKQMIEKAAESVTNQNVNERDIAALTIAIHPEDLKEIKEFLKKKRRELNKSLTNKYKMRKPTEVYCLTTQFFRISK